MTGGRLCGVQPAAGRVEAVGLGPFASRFEGPGAGVAPGRLDRDLGPFGATALQIEGIEPEAQQAGHGDEHNGRNGRRRQPAEWSQGSPGHG